MAERKDLGDISAKITVGYRAEMTDAQKLQTQLQKQAQTIIGIARKTLRELETSVPKTRPEDFLNVSRLPKEYKALEQTKHQYATMRALQGQPEWFKEWATKDIIPWVKQFTEQKPRTFTQGLKEAAVNISSFGQNIVSLGKSVAIASGIVGAAVYVFLKFARQIIVLMDYFKELDVNSRRYLLFTNRSFKELDTVYMRSIAIADKYKLTVKDTSQLLARLAVYQASYNIKLDAATETFVKIARIQGISPENLLSQLENVVGMMGSGTGSARALVSLGVSGQPLKDILDLAKSGKSDVALLKLIDTLEKRYKNVNPEEFATFGEKWQSWWSRTFTILGVGLKEVSETRLAQTGFTIGKTTLDNTILFPLKPLFMWLESLQTTANIMQEATKLPQTVSPRKDVYLSSFMSAVAGHPFFEALGEKPLQQLSKDLDVLIANNQLPKLKNELLGVAAGLFAIKNNTDLTSEAYNNFIQQLNLLEIGLQRSIGQMENFQRTGALRDILYATKFGIEEAQYRSARGGFGVDLDQLRFVRMMETTAQYLDTQLSTVKELYSIAMTGNFGIDLDKVKEKMMMGDPAAFDRYIQLTKTILQDAYLLGKISHEQLVNELDRLDVLNNQRDAIVRILQLRKQEEELLQKQKEWDDKKKQFMEQNQTPQDIIARIRELQQIAASLIAEGANPQEVDAKYRMALAGLLQGFARLQKQAQVQLPQTLIWGQKGTISEINKIRLAGQGRRDPVKDIADQIKAQLGVQQNQLDILRAIEIAASELAKKIGAGR